MNVYQTRQLLKTKSIYDMNLRFVYYARVSSEKEEQKNSIENQKDYYENFIRQNRNWKFCGGYVDDGISGIHAEKREEFQRMLADARAGKFDFIITKEISRFARNTLDSIQYTRELLSYGVCVWFQNDNINTIDDDSEFRLTIMAGVAQDEIRKLSSRVRFGHAQAIKNGVVLGNSMLYGYDKKDGKLTVNEAEAGMIRLIFEKYATGTWSTPRIEKLIYEKGYRNHKGAKIDRGVIKNIIRNPKYKGWYAGGKVKIVDMFTKKQEFLPESEWNMFKDNGDRVPAIVSEELWDSANAIYKKRGEEIKSRRSSFKSNNLFTGKIFCGIDGEPYWLKYHKLRGKQADGKWGCRRKLREGADSCRSFWLSEKELLTIIAQIINSTDIDISACAQKYLEIFKRVAQRRVALTEPEDVIRQKIENVYQKMDKLLNYNLEGIISDEDFFKKNGECRSELKSLKQKLSAYENVGKQDSKGIDAKIIQIQKNLESYKGISEEEIDGAVIQKLIDRIVVYPTGEKKASLTFFLNTGEHKEMLYGSSGHTFKNMISERNNLESGVFSTLSSSCFLLKICPERNIEFYRNLRSFPGHKVLVEYTYSLAI